ncbi:hypothetical protein [Leptothoe sp. PORK10 BA2]|uniref:hypothetical protein n=1 Tax=Leptothoe sp. PORK10 BA2 TaxID=3110254 RepID=UPI002B20C2C9|nr:hypothetical protein [Leptothoe sp. PORK10 BA2]MEA5466212.1 hypothetical protein [Leptothoe sp. PORK10 BA2]
MSASYYSLWLVPQAPDLDYFQHIINTLSERFGTVPFCPHVTLYSGLLPPTVDLKQLCAMLPSEPVELTVVNLRHESRFAKTLYIQLIQSAALSHLVNGLVTAIPNAQTPKLDPHVSLLYHSLDVATKQTLVDTITLPRPTIQFNQVQVMAAPQNFETQEHVSQLRCVHCQFLATP